MRSKLFEERPKRAQTSAERWIRVMPDKGEGYWLYDAVAEDFIGRILVDADDNWIYDGSILSLEEQEDMADFIIGNHKEMDNLIRDL